MAATCRRSETLCLTVIERVADTDAVREHCRRRVRTVRPGSLADRLAASSETLRNREHRFYYATPPPHATAVLPLDDAVSFGVFSEWSRRGNVNDVYAVVGNRATSDHEKVVKLYVNRMPRIDTDQSKHFKQTVAKPFSHRPMEPEVDSLDDRTHKHKSSKHTGKHPSDTSSFGRGGF